MSYLVFIGVLVSALAALSVTVQRDDAAGARCKRSFAYIVFAGAALSAIGGHAMRVREADLRTQFETDLRVQTEQLLSKVTGGDGFCTITFLMPFTDRSRAIVANRSDEPLYDVTVRITDLDRLPDLEPGEHVNFDEFMDTQVMLDIGNLPGGATSFVNESWDFSGDVRRRYRMFFGARNGAWIEDLTLLRGDGNWTYTMTVSRGDSIVYEHKDGAYDEVLAGYEAPLGAP